MACAVLASRFKTETNEWEVRAGPGGPCDGVKATRLPPSYRLGSTRGRTEAGEVCTLCASLSRFRGALVLAANEETGEEGKGGRRSAQAPPQEAEETGQKGKDWPGHLQNLPNAPHPHVATQNTPVPATAVAVTRRTRPKPNPRKALTHGPAGASPSPTQLLGTRHRKQTKQSELGILLSDQEVDGSTDSLRDVSLP